MADVFISYKREKREDVVRIAEALRAIELDIWFDARLQSGVSLQSGNRSGVLLCSNSCDVY